MDARARRLAAAAAALAGDDGGEQEEVQEEEGGCRMLHWLLGSTVLHAQRLLPQLSHVGT